MRIQRLSVLGVGLIGGSLARALRHSDAVGEVVGCGRGLANLQRALQLGVVDRITQDAGEAVRGADMVLVAVPLFAMRGVMAAIAPALSNDAIITDAGSAKGSVVADARATLGAHLSSFVPGHPVAGTEKSGVEASFRELFIDRKVILTPIAETSPEAHKRVADMWRIAGADVHDMAVEDHDRILAATSHLPHMLAYTLVNSLCRMDDSREIFRYAAGGFADFTRIASSSPEMWHDIVMCNKEAVLKALKVFQGDLTALMALLRQGRGDQVRELFKRAKEARDYYTQERSNEAGSKRA
jgi:prephenate dehydrogenase